MKTMQTNEDSATELLKKLEFLYEKYSDELRAMTQPYQLRRIEKLVPNYHYQPDDPLVRENLLEHAGSLPVMATAFYPYIKDDEVDLGQALTMLAIHDIGELVHGDTMTFLKKDSAKDSEQAAAFDLLDPMYHELYQDVESQTSKTAKFAKSIDKITPDILEYFSPADITIVRYKHFLNIGPEEIIPLVEKKKRPYMTWSPFLADFHAVLMEKLKTKLAEAQA